MSTVIWIILIVLMVGTHFFMHRGHGGHGGHGNDVNCRQQEHNHKNQ